MVIIETLAPIGPGAMWCGQQRFSPGLRTSGLVGSTVRLRNISRTFVKVRAGTSKLRLKNCCPNLSDQAGCADMNGKLALIC